MQYGQVCFKSPGTASLSTFRCKYEANSIATVSHSCLSMALSRRSLPRPALQTPLHARSTVANRSAALLPLVPWCSVRRKRWRFVTTMPSLCVSSFFSEVTAASFFLFLSLGSAGLVVRSRPLQLKERKLVARGVHEHLQLLRAICRREPRLRGSRQLS